MSRDYVLQPFRSPVNLQIDYARELNPQQHAAVTAPPGPALVLAGAGAGKTRTLIYRVAYLLEQGITPDRILLLTFTNKAAREMMRRVADLLGNDLTDLWGGTFHSIGHRFLRRHAERIGHRKDFTILDREDSKELIKTCIAESEIDRPERGERFVGFDLALQRRCAGGAFVFERAMRVRTGHVVVEDHVPDARGFALQKPRKLVLVIVEERQRIVAAGGELADRSA